MSIALNGNIHRISVLFLSVPLLCVALAGEPLGLVLSGGAAKGAYEVGVWQALIESDLANDVSSISGTSVGAINAALFASVKDTTKCIRLWEEEISGIFRFNTNLVVHILGDEGRAKIERAYSRMSRNIAEDMAYAASKRGCGVFELPQDIKSEIEDRCEAVARKRLFLELPKMKTLSAMLCDYDESRPMEGFMPINRLQALILQELPRSWRWGCPAVYATALRKGKDSLSIVTFAIQKARPEQRASMICASACLPFLFGAHEVNGATYIDGGLEAKGGDNVPIGPIVENHPNIKTVIVVYLDDESRISPGQRDRVQRVAKIAGVKLVEIMPSKDINGALGVFGYMDDSKETVRRLIELGRKDTENTLKKGNKP